jgi:hypothetical protein
VLLGSGCGRVVEGGGILLIKVGEPGGVANFPPVRAPSIEVALEPGGEVHQQLRQVELWIKVVPAAACPSICSKRAPTNGSPTESKMRP